MSDDPAPHDPTVLHASCVALAGAAALILGASGRGKSTLALQLLALGGALVADDQTVLHLAQNGAEASLIADAPASLRGLIEMRGVGILHAPAHGPCAVRLVVDLDKVETERLPPLRRTVVAGLEMPLLHMVDSTAFPAAILQYLKHGRAA